MTDRSTRASSDSESDASRTQRQAVGGAPQARSGVERDNQRGNVGGMSEVARSSFETPCSDENQPSTSQRLQRMRNQCQGQLAGVKLGITRAALDQRRREQRALLRMKTMRIQYLKKRCEEIAAEVNSQFDTLSERLLQYQGDPNWLIECFAVIFNESAATVVEYENEVKQLYKEVAELKHAVYKRVQVKKSGPSVSAVQNVPAESVSVPEASSVPLVAGFPLHHNPFRILDHEIHLTGLSESESDDEEETVPLLDPRRNRSDHSVSSLVQKQETSAGELPAEPEISFQSAYGNQDQNCPSPSVNQTERDNPVQSEPENTPPENPQTMSRSEWNPREPPTFSGRLKEDVHQWTAIVTQYFTFVPGTNQQQLTYAVSLLRGYAIEWYNAEVKKDNPIDWKSLAEALILRFGSTARSKRALLKIMQLKQDKDDVLQYAAKFESFKAQMETYDEQMLLMRFIFGLKDDLIEPVFMQYPKTVQEAKQVAENLEIVHQGIERHDKTAKGKNQMLNKKQSKKGILGNVSVERGQSSIQSAGVKTRSRKTRNSFASFSCNISRDVHQKSVQNSLFSRPPVQKGTILEKSSDRKCAAARWREFIRPLSHRD